MKVAVKPNYEEISRAGAKAIVRELLTRDKPVLGLPTGNTPKRTYELLVKYYEEGLVDFSEVTTFNLDEYYPISVDDPRSFHSYMEENLFRWVNIEEKDAHLLNGEVGRSEVEAHCSDYERKISDAGGLDLTVLGIGENGHIGFNEPGVDFGTTTRLVELQEFTVEKNFKTTSSAPKRALTMGLKTITRSRKILLLASGESKADAVKGAVFGPVTEECPASVLQLHPDVTFLLDQGAAKKIDLGSRTGQDYCRRLGR